MNHEYCEILSQIKRLERAVLFNQLVSIFCVVTVIVAMGVHSGEARTVALICLCGVIGLVLASSNIINGKRELFRIAEQLRGIL